MGLDVSIVKDVMLVDEPDYESGEQFFRATVVDPRWSSRIARLEEGRWYTGIFERRISYPCRMHNNFRRWLAELIGKERDYWISDNNSEGDPFHELMEFADNEGCMDCDTSRKLYEDFSEWEIDVRPLPDCVFKEKYYEWLEVFRIAKDEGVVWFH